MKNESYLAKVCEGCDYSPALCDGDVCTCESASLHGANSEIGRRNGAFEKKEFERELDALIDAALSASSKETARRYLIQAENKIY